MHFENQDISKMNKIYHLSTCNTCSRIINELQLPEDFTLQDIKTEPITEAQLEAMRNLTDSYESLFSKRARLYKELGLKDKTLTDDDYKNYILDHYTFLKRPVLIVDEQIFIGNAKKTVEAAKAALHG
ncbi:arsenate reductase-like glutaredoxin family protein [Winogradskyella arenosi]|uniref:Arsenate reductase-like glutaredoxin family protein n=2 Tax=Winogradskyella arenosi TaxID=533325 RepID=A0A368ZI45_9FLAO|nr:arsenate reductase-like glutaredoxin family protein [Winogradskyella arenosi]